MVQASVPSGVPVTRNDGMAWAKAFGEGLPVTMQQALAYAFTRVNGRVDPNAFLQSALISRDITMSAGESQQSSLSLGTCLLVTSVSIRIYLTDSDDDTSMVTSQLRLPNLQGFLLGDTVNDFNSSLLAENATWMPLVIPWVLFPLDQAQLIATAASTMAGQAQYSLGLMGTWLYGIMG